MKEQAVMIKKQITDLILVSAKFFLDLDHAYCAYILLVITTIAFLCRQMFRGLPELFVNGVAAVKEDVNQMKRLGRLCRERIRMGW